MWLRENQRSLGNEPLFVVSFDDFRMTIRLLKQRMFNTVNGMQRNESSPPPPQTKPRRVALAAHSQLLSRSSVASQREQAYELSSTFAGSEHDDIRAIRSTKLVQRIRRATVACKSAKLSRSAAIACCSWRRANRSARASRASGGTGFLLARPNQRSSHRRDSSHMPCLRKQQGRKQRDSQE